MTVTSILDRVVLFSGLPLNEQHAVSACLRRRFFSKDEPVFRRDDSGSSLFIVEFGSVNIELADPDGKQIRIAERRSGDFFGEVALMDGGTRSADAIAAEDSQLLELERQDLLDLLKSRPEIAVRLVVVLSQRLREDAHLVGDTAFLDVAGRLANAILRLAGTSGRREEDRIIIEVPLTQHDLAAMVGATRESVNRTLANYERLGFLEYRRGKITILHPEKLAMRVY